MINGSSLSLKVRHILYRQHTVCLCLEDKCFCNNQSLCQDNELQREVLKLSTCYIRFVHSDLLRENIIRSIYCNIHLYFSSAFANSSGCFSVSAPLVPPFNAYFYCFIVIVEVKEHCFPEYEKENVTQRCAFIFSSLSFYLPI